MGRRISLILPFYNEELNVRAVIADAVPVLAEISAEYEIIAVNDGSLDSTAVILNGLAEDNQRIKPVHHEVNGGYGHALRSGITAATGDWIFLCDGDRQFFMDELLKFAECLRTYPLAIGFRVDRRDPWIRKFNSYLYNLAAAMILGMRVRDINCAMKAFHRSIICDVNCRTYGQVINLDILSQVFRIKDLHFVEIAVNHRPRPAGQATGARPHVIATAIMEYIKLFKDEFPHVVVRARVRKYHDT